MRKTILAALFSGLFLPFVNAQNLVQNPSFEEGAICNGENENLDSVAHWRIIAGSPKLMNPNCPLSADAKTYIQGMQFPPAFEGDAYAGLGIAEEGEFIQSKLKKGLKKDETYWVKARVRLPTRFCSLPIQELGVLFSDKALPVSEAYRKIDNSSTVLRRDAGKLIDSGYDWTEVSTMYTAKGDEQYITLGNFGNNNNSQLKDRKKNECSYLFIDWVVVEAFKELKLEVFSPEMTLVKNERVWLKNLQFVKEVIDKNGQKELKSLAGFLVKNPDIRLEISSHTDNSQEAMSKSRAQAVVDFLVKKKIDAKRLKAVAKGSTENIVPNTTPENIAKNNRIEIKSY